MNYKDLVIESPAEANDSVNPYVKVYMFRIREMIKAAKGERWAASLKLCTQDRMVLSHASMVPTATKLRGTFTFYFLQ